MNGKIHISEHRIQPRPGAVEERHLLLRVTDPSLSFDEQLAALAAAYTAATDGTDVLL